MLTRWLSPQNPQATQQNFVFDKNNRVVSKPQAVENQFEIRNYELGIVDAVFVASKPASSTRHAFRKISVGRRILIPNS